MGYFFGVKKHFLQGNEIGCGGGNTVNRADRYGLLIGSSDTVILSEMTKIENNNFNENNVGMCVSNITGIVNIKNNTFNKNSAGIEIIGFSNDTYWGNNIFKGSTGNSEMISSESYDGSMFYDIWRNNDNKFSIDTYSQVDEAMSGNYLYHRMENVMFAIKLRKLRKIIQRVGNRIKEMLTDQL